MKKIYSILAALSLLALVPACEPTPVPGGDDKQEENKGDNKPLSGTMTLSVDEPVIRADGESAATFTVMIGDSLITEGVKFYDANDKPVEIENMQFKTTVPGEYTFWASYKAFFSDPVEVKAMSVAVPVVPADSKPSSNAFTKRILLTQFTGTSCGYCPGMIELIGQLAKDSQYSDKFVHVACHSYNDNDPAFIECNLPSAMGVNAYPNACYNLDASTVFGTQNLSKTHLDFDKQYNKAAKAGIAAAAVLDGNQVVVKAGIKAGEDGNYRLAAWLLEDGIQGKQANYMSGTWTGDYNTHNNCLRSFIGQVGSKDFTGDSVNLKALEKAEQFMVFNTKSSWVGENLHVVIFVSTNDGGAYHVNNIIDCPVNSSVSYEYSE